MQIGRRDVIDYTAEKIEDILKTGIYAIKHLLFSDKVYVGMATSQNHKSGDTGFLCRWKRHLTELKNGKSQILELQEIVNKFGVCWIRFEILQFCEENFLEEENNWVKYYQKTAYCYNINFRGRKRPKEFGEKMRKIMIERNHRPSQETIEKIKIVNRNRKWTEEQRNQRYINRKDKRFIYLYDSFGNLCNIFESGAACDRFFNLRIGRSSEHVAANRKIKKQFLPSYNPLTKEKILEITRKHRGK